jgi:AraC-like DNA-binding protein
VAGTGWYFPVITPRLSCGLFLGDTRHTHQSTDLLATETHYRAGESLQRHSHERAYFCLVREGAYSETYDGRRRECGPMTFAYHPAGEVHAEQFHERDVVSFNLEVSPQWVGLVRQHTSILDQPFAMNDGPPSRLAERLYQYFHHQAQCFGLLLEGLLLQIVAEAAGRPALRGRRRPVPDWVDQVRELLECSYVEPPALSELASQFGIHPVYLANGFRRHVGCTIGEFVRQARVRRASERLLRTDESIAAIAAAVGFADQSHLTRVFRQLTGTTPAAWRRADRAERRSGRSHKAT